MRSSPRKSPARKRPEIDSGAAVMPAMDSQQCNKDGKVIDASGGPVADDESIAVDLLLELEEAVAAHPMGGRQVWEMMRGALDVSAFKQLEGGLHQSVSSKRRIQDIAQTLQGAADLGDSEAGDLSQLIDRALATFDREKTSVAIEFDRIYRERGESAALNWLKAHGRPATVSKKNLVPGAEGRPPSESLKSEVAKSRSRRLRGPPK